MEMQSFCKDCRADLLIYGVTGGIGWRTPIAAIPDLQIQVVVRSEETRTGPESGAPLAPQESGSAESVCFLAPDG